MSKINTIMFVVFAALGTVACAEDPITTIDRTTDCSDICDKYKDCIQSDYDTDSCTKQCKDMTSDDETKKIDDCQDCISGDNSCVDKAFKCTDECGSIIAKSSN